MKTHLRKLIVSALFAALVCGATMAVKIPSPLGGYLNLGDCVVLCCGFFLSPPFAFSAAGIGSALADLFSGYVLYVPATFVIKGLCALLAHFLFQTLKRPTGPTFKAALAALASEFVMVLGYFLYESFFYGLPGALLNVPANAVQGLAGIFLGCSLFHLLQKRRFF